MSKRIRGIMDDDYQPFTTGTLDMLPTRRCFLRNAGIASAVLAGGLASPGVVAARGSELQSRSKRCGFSALPADFVYLNTGTEGSMPECVLSNFQNGLQQWASNPTTSYELDPTLGKPQELNRTKAARFLGVQMENICLTDNTTMGLSMTLMGLNFDRDDCIVTTNHEHNAIKSPLQILQQRIGLRVVTRPFPTAAALSRMSSTVLLDALFPNIPELRGAAAMCVSHVYPTTGVRLPLRALREKADALNIRYLIVDGAQALGMIDLSDKSEALLNTDFYAAPGHKWLNGPPSTGLLYLRNADIRPPEFFPTISQRMPKYAACDETSRSCFPIAEALQIRGCSNTPGFAAMISAMEYADSIGGAAAVQKHILKLSQEIRNIVLARAPGNLVSPHTTSELASGLTTFFPFRWDKPGVSFSDKKTADGVVAALLEKNIQVRSIGFADGDSNTSYVVRVSTGYLNTIDQVGIFRTALRDVLTRVR